MKRAAQAMEARARKAQKGEAPMRPGKVLSAVALLAASTVVAMAGPAAQAATGVQRQVIPSPGDGAGNRFGFAAVLNVDNGTVALDGAPGTNPPTPFNT